jgi:hypothetical protein
VIERKVKTMAEFENQWRDCKCNFIVQSHSMIWENKKIPLKDKSITNNDTVICPFGIFGCGQYKVSDKGEIASK